MHPELNNIASKQINHWTNKLGMDFTFLENFFLLLLRGMYGYGVT